MVGAHGAGLTNILFADNGDIDHSDNYEGEEEREREKMRGGGAVLVEFTMDKLGSTTNFSLKDHVAGLQSGAKEIKGDVKDVEKVKWKEYDARETYLPITNYRRLCFLTGYRRGEIRIK